MALLSAKSARLPSKGNPLDVFYCTDTKETYLVAGDGVLLNVRDILQGNVPVRAVGPQGQPGRDGLRGDKGDKGDKGEPGKDSIVPGPKGVKGDSGSDGLPGLAGKDGRDGKDSIVPGPPGRPGEKGERGEKGDRGEKGERGDLSVIGDAELLAAVEKLRAQKAAVLANLTDRLAAMGDHPIYRIARQHLEQVLEEAKK